MNPDILSFSAKAPPREIHLPGTSFPLPPGLDVVLDGTSRVVGVYQHGELKANYHLSQKEFLAMLIFYEQYPCFAPDARFIEAFGGIKVLTNLRERLRFLDIDIKRMRETGYYIGQKIDVPSNSTFPEAVLA